MRIEAGHSQVAKTGTTLTVSSRLKRTRRESRFKRYWMTLVSSIMGVATQPEGKVRLSNQGPKKVLVVDDDAATLKITSAKLKAAGFEAITAIDASEAISKVRETKPDFILLDVNFPPDVGNGGSFTCDGLQLMSWLQGSEDTAGTRFIIMSGSETKGLRDRALTSGAEGFFRKPINCERLVQTLHQVSGTQLTRIRQAGYNPQSN